MNEISRRGNDLIDKLEAVAEAASPTVGVKLPEPAVMCDCGGNYYTAEQVTAAIQADRQRQEKDAERYRWLRDKAENFGYEDDRPSPWAVLGVDHVNQRPCCYAELDAAIDAALAALKETQ